MSIIMFITSINAIITMYIIIMDVIIMRIMYMMMITSAMSRWKTGRWSFQSPCQICKKPRTCIEIPPLTGHNEITVRMIRIVTKFTTMMIMMRID